jgi:hypothetical protein
MEMGFHPNGQQQQGRQHVDGRAYTLIGRVRQDVEHTYPSIHLSVRFTVEDAMIKNLQFDSGLKQ